MKHQDKHRETDLEERLAALGAVDRGKGLRLIPALLGVALLACVLGLVYLLFTFAFDSEQAAGKGSVVVTVEEGDTLDSVATKLADSGAIGNATVFKLEARVEGAAADLKPGEYRIPPETNNQEILATLSAGQETPTFTMTIPEGLTLDQTARTVAKQSDISVEDFEDAARRTDYGYAFLEGPGIQTTEGFLFPKKYEFEEGVDAPVVVDRMLGQYLQETQGLDIEEAQESLGLSEYEILTVASLIEKEAANDEERPLVASVIYNRLREDMPLQIDATIQYALGKPKENLSLEDLEVDSPYNTYKIKGLPPGPIADPGLESIKAALEPADTSYQYYVLDAGGDKHTFTDNYDDFVKAKEAAGR